MMRSLYRWLLFLYPADYRVIFGAEMAEVFDEAYAEASRDAWCRVTFCLRELLGLIRTAFYVQTQSRCGAKLEQLTTRFGKSRVVIMALIFAFLVVVATIEILKSFALHRPHSGPLALHQFVLGLLEWLILAYIGGVIGGAIAFVVRCTRRHWLTKTDTGPAEY